MLAFKRRILRGLRKRFVCKTMISLNFGGGLQIRVRRFDSDLGLHY